MREEKNKTRFALAGAVIAAVTASLCCILPVIAAVLGVTGLAASEYFARWRPYLLAVTSGLLALGFYLAYRRPRREACEVGSVCERTPIGRWSRAMLWLVAGLVIVLAAFPYYSGWAARAVTGSTQPRVLSTENSQARVVLQIDGMSCSACAALLEKRLSQIPGVHHGEVSLEKKQATLEYDPRQVDPWRFAKTISDAGYKVAMPPPVSN